VTSEPITVAEYKAALREKLLQGGVVSADVVDRMEVMFDLTRLTSRLSRDFEAVHRPRGWTWAGFRIANMLWVVGSLAPGELARLSGASRASISSALNTLEAGGYVTRTTNARNRRHVEVALTSKGRRALTKAIGRQAQREHAWLDALTPEEGARLAKLVARLVQQPRPD
jgi:DNA-binding MarR family transcriptional regulator